MANTDYKQRLLTSSHDNLLNSDLLAKILGTDAMQMLRCGVCLEFFDNPTVLPCGHTFCFDCLADMCRQAATSCVPPVRTRAVRVACPACRVLIYAAPILEQNVTCNVALRGLLACLRARPPAGTEPPRTPATPLSDHEVQRVTCQVDALLQAATPTSLLDHAAAEVEEIRSQNIAESANLKKALTGQRDIKQSQQEQTKQVANIKEYMPYVPSFKHTKTFPTPPKCQLNLSIAPPVGNCMLNLLPAPPGFKQAPIFVPQNSMAKQTSSNTSYNFNNINKHYGSYNNTPGANRKPSVENISCHMNNLSLQNNQTINCDNNGTTLVTSKMIGALPVKKLVDIPSNNNNGASAFNSFDINRVSHKSQAPLIANNCHVIGQNTTSMQHSVFGSNTTSGFVPGKIIQPQGGFMNIIEKPMVNKTSWNIGGFGSVMGEELGYNSRAFEGSNSAGNKLRNGGFVAIGGEQGFGSKMGDTIQHLNNDPAVMSVVTTANGNCFKSGI